MVGTDEKEGVIVGWIVELTGLLTVVETPQVSIIS
jgi:hypothetical protein